MEEHYTKVICFRTHRRPSPLANTLRVFLNRSKGLAFNAKLPLMEIRLQQFRIDGGHYEKYRQILECSREDPGHRFLYPMTIAYPLHMRILSHKAIPLSMFRVLNIRNHIAQHHRFSLSETFDIRCFMNRHRCVPKGLELDMYTTFETKGRLIWESVTTYYFKGKFGESPYKSAAFKLPGLGKKNTRIQFTIPRRTGFPFATVSGDTNGIHYMDLYARLFGFRGAFVQPVQTLAWCLRSLSPLDLLPSRRMDVLIKGPVYYDRSLTQHSSKQGGAFRFDLYCEGDERPCIRGLNAPFEPVPGKNLQTLVSEAFNAKNLE